MYVNMKGFVLRGRYSHEIAQLEKA